MEVVFLKVTDCESLYCCTGDWLWVVMLIGDVPVEAVNDGAVQCVVAAEAAQWASVVLVVSSVCWHWRRSTPAAENCIINSKGCDVIRGSWPECHAGSGLCAGGLHHVRLCWCLLWEATEAYITVDLSPQYSAWPDRHRVWPLCSILQWWPAGKLVCLSVSVICKWNSCSVCSASAVTDADHSRTQSGWLDNLYQHRKSMQ